MTWLPFTVAALTGAGLLALVGGALSWALGLRGLWAIAAAPAFAITTIGLASTIAPWAGMTWSLLPVALLTLVLGSVILMVRRRWVHIRRDPESPAAPGGVWLVGALALAAVFLSWRVCVALGDPSNFSQTFDDIFHLNAIRYILDTGNASSLHVGSMTSPSGTLPFYPAGWHALVSLVVEISGVAIPVGVNAVTLVISAVIWPLGAVLLARTLFGRGAIVTVAAAVASCGIPAFPFLLMDYGVLFPFQLGLALVPVALAAALTAMGVASGSSLPRWWWALVLAGTIPGVALAHPGAFVAVLALTVPMVLLFAWRLFRGARGGRRVAVVVAVVAYAAVGAVLLRVLRPPAEARGWPPALSPGDAVGQVLTASMWYALPAFAVAIAVLAGVIAAVLERSAPALTAVAMYLIAAGLFVVVSSLTYQPLRDVLTGSWYNNIPRLAAILPVTMVPLAAYGADRLWRALRKMASRTAPRGVAVVAAALAAAGTVAVLMGPVVPVTAFVNASYRITADSPLVSADEYALLERLDEHVPPGAAVAGSAWTGAGLAYALADRRVVMPHTLMEMSSDVDAINDGLATATAGSPTCAALRRHDVGFVLDFGEHEILPGRHDYPGLDGLASSPAVQLIDSQGDARLYRIIACG